MKEQLARRRRTLRKRIATAAASVFVLAWAAVFGQSQLNSGSAGASSGAADENGNVQALGETDDSESGLIGITQSEAPSSVTQTYSPSPAPQTYAPAPVTTSQS